jgi:hypothetical protein
MAYDGGSGQPYRRPAPGDHPLTHRISNLSDITDLDTYQSDSSNSLRGRVSLVSLQSAYDGPRGSPVVSDVSRNHSVSSSWAGSFSYSSGGGGYEPVSVTGGIPPRNTRTPSRGLSLRMQSQQETIPEEEYDLSLLRSAAQMGQSPEYDSIPENEPMEVAFDLTATLGPSTSHDEEFIRRLQEQEASGRLTGGLGAGFVPATTIASSELLRSPVAASRTLTRSLTRRQTGLNRAATIRGMGQEEANRRGEVIEIVLDEPTDVDLSSMVGPDALETGPMRRPPHQNQSKDALAKKTLTLYPEYNWKPYLSVLVFLSVALAVGQEILLQRSLKEPLMRFHKPSDVPGIEYFAVKFVPTLVAVLYGVLWQVVDFEVKRLEAYYQLSKKEGALAAESINVDYVTSFNFLRPFHALKMKHYAVTISSCATLLAVSLVPTFSAASILLSPDRPNRLKDPNGEKQIMIHTTWSRFLTATLCVCAVFCCMLLYLLESRKSGLLADVRGIAGLASLANKSHILVDFQDMDTVKHTDLHHKLKHHRYVLRSSSLAPDDENPVSTAEKRKFQKHYLSENPHPLMLRAVGIIPFIIGIVLFSGFIPAFLFTPATIVTDRAPWIVTALAVCIKLSWGSLETDVRMMEPFYVLSRRHAPSKTLTLDYTALPFGYLPFRAFLNGHILMAMVGFGSVIAEVLTILLTSLATVEGRDFIGQEVDPSSNRQSQNPEGLEQINSGQETPLSFWISLGLALFILLYMAVVATIVFVRRRHPFLPRQPNTIASILAYIHQSKMLYSFVNTEKLTNREMVEKLHEIGKTYGLGWFEGRDGQTHCGVDQEELISNYKHGVDFEQANKPWNSQWEYL